MSFPDPSEFLKTNTEGPDPEDYSVENIDTPKANPPDYWGDVSSDKSMPPVSSDPVLQLMSDYRNTPTNKFTNPYQLGKEQIFGAGIDHHAYERYYAHPSFDQLGFSPFRDNESFYNENSNFFDDLARATPQFWNLAGIGFMDSAGFGSLTDTETAKAFERSMAIGQSSREGVGAFGINLMLNSGYTFGILTELALEELGLAALTAGSVGLSSGFTVPAMGTRGIRAGNKIVNAWQTGKNIVKTLDNLQDLNRARVYFRKARQSAGRFFNPLEQTMALVNAKRLGKLDNLDNFAKVSIGMGSFYRDIRNMRLVYSESSLEGGMVQNQMEKELLAEHYAKHGRAPSDQEAATIKETANQAGLSAAYWNMPVIFLSNKVVFDNMFKALSPMRRLSSSVIEEAGGKIVKTAAKESPYVVLDNGIKGFTQGLKHPQTLLKSGLNYFKANFAEGFQESAQEIISGTAVDYYKNSMGSGHRGGVYSHIGNNIEKQLTGEGAEIFFSGFLMGGLVQPVTKAVGMVPKYSASGFKYMFNREAYNTQQDRKAEFKQRREEELNEKVNTLNELYDDPLQYFAPDLDNMVQQIEYAKGMKASADKGYLKEFYDLKDASAFQHIMTALKTGKYEGFVDRLTPYREYTENEMKEAFPSMTDHTAFITSIETAITRAENIKTRFDNFNREHPNPFNPHQYKYGSKAFKQEAIRKVAYDDAIEHLLFHQHSFDRSLERIENLQQELVEDSGLSNVAATDISPLYSFKQMNARFIDLKRELELFENEDVITPEAKTLKKEKQRQFKALENYIEKFQNYQQLIGKDVSPGKQSKAVKSLRNAYGKYLNVLATDKDTRVFEENLDKSFRKLLDVYSLDYDSDQLVEAINKLTDPEYMTRHIQEIESIKTALYRDRKEHLRTALSNYEKKMEQPNQLMQVLHNENMFFDPEQLAALIEDGRLPTKFYYAKTADGNRKALDAVSETSKDYQKALEIVSDYVEVILDKPITEKQDGYAIRSRERLSTDKRTYEDYAEQFGFDPKAKETHLSLPEVLTVITDSEYATETEVALASELFELAKKDEKVIFIKGLSSAGTFSELGQTQVDARYASEDYKEESAPLETVILQQELKRRIEEHLKDDNFKNELEKVFTAVKNYYTQEGKTMPSLGMNSLLEFSHQAMVNPTFQRELLEVPFEDSNAGNTWGGFVDAVVNLFKRLFGKNVSGTALNGVIHTVTTRLSAKPVEQKEVTKKPAITSETPINELPADLLARLVSAYKEENSSRSERGLDLLDGLWQEKTDQQITESGAFKNFVRGDFSRSNKVISQYNQDTGREIAIKKETSTSAPLIISESMKTKLEDMGYGPGEISIMSPATAQQIINQGVSKFSLQSEEAQIMQEQADTNRRIGEEITREITELIAGATNIQGLEMAENRIRSIVGDYANFSKSELTTDAIEQMVEAKKKEFAFTVRFEDLKVGEVVIMNDQFETRMRVDEKTTMNVKLTKVNDPSFTRTVNMKQIEEKIKYKYSKAMDEIGLPTQSVSEKEKNISNEDLAVAQSLNDQKGIEEDINQAKAASKDDLLNDLLDDVEKC